MTKTGDKIITVDDLIDEYDGWRATAERDGDDFDSLTKLAAFYRFAIAHHSEPGGELLLRAAAVVQAAEKDRS